MDHEMDMGDPMNHVPGSSSGDDFSQTIVYPPLPNYQVAHWKYEMRREMQEICPNVFFGSYASAAKKKLDELKHAAFTHIVCVRHVLERRVIKPNHLGHFLYKIVEMNENSLDSIIPRCMDVCEFVKNSLDEGGKILIHGNSGAGSSAILIIAFVMFRYGVTPKEAYQYVQQRRFCIRPTDNYLEQLREFEPIFRAKQLEMLWAKTNGRGQNGDGNRKRNIDDALETDSSYSVGLSKRVIGDSGDEDDDYEYCEDMEQMVT